MLKTGHSKEASTVSCVLDSDNKWTPTIMKMAMLLLAEVVNLPGMPFSAKGNCNIYISSSLKRKHNLELRRHVRTCYLAQLSHFPWVYRKVRAGRKTEWGLGSSSADSPIRIVYSRLLAANFRGLTNENRAVWAGVRRTASVRILYEGKKRVPQIRAPDDFLSNKRGDKIH